MKNRKSAKITGGKLFVYIMLGIISLYFIIPFLWMLLTAFKTESEAFAFPPKLFPSEFRIRNFVDAWNSQPFFIYLRNSVIITFLTTLGQVLSSSAVAYGFARYNFKGKNILFLILLGTMMIPWDVIVIPLYMEFKMLKWINTLKPLIVPAFFGSAYYIFLLRQFLMGIPKDFEDAAYIDGANDWQTYSRIFLPMMKAPLILVCVLNIITVWNDYLGPLVFLNSRDKYTLPLGLAAFKGMHEMQVIPIMAITSLMIIPPIIVFAFAQKYIIEGVSGALKG
jgi:multiple sugar transport system permease protein